MQLLYNFSKKISPILSVSIPQAVGTVATMEDLGALQQFESVSIPQAVGTVATVVESKKAQEYDAVSIPQAVGTVATHKWIY